MSLCSFTITQLHNKLKNREISSLDITNALLKRISKFNKALKAYITVMPESARQQARNADCAIRQGGMNFLTGIPIAIKDNISLRSAPTTCGSKMLKNYHSPYDATVVGKLKDLGVVFLGKTNMDEFAMGSSTENSWFGPCNNPWNSAYIPGGSSGGSAAAVAAHLSIASLGSDTGGSIRQPASHCGAVGLKPTYGRVSRYGLIAFASSLDQIGPITKNVQDCAILLKAISGYDSRDSTSADRDVPDFTAGLNWGVKGLKIGVPKEYFTSDVDKEVTKTITRAISYLNSEGADIIDISLPHTGYAVSCYYIIAPAEASSNLARYDGVRYGFRSKTTKNVESMYKLSRRDGLGPEVIRRVMLGTYTLSRGYYDDYYKKAAQLRTLTQRDFQEAFRTCHALITPVAPTPPFRIGEKVHSPLAMYLSDVFTVPASLAGIPCISVPYGMSGKKLPIGVQLLGNYFEETMLLRIASVLEKTSGVSDQQPAL